MDLYLNYVCCDLFNEGFNTYPLLEQSASLPCSPQETDIRFKFYPRLTVNLLCLYFNRVLFIGYVLYRFQFVEAAS